MKTLALIQPGNFNSIPKFPKIKTSRKVLEVTG